MGASQGSEGAASHTPSSAAQLKEAYIAIADRFARPGKDAYRDQRNTPAMLAHARKVVDACRNQNLVDFKLAEVHEVTQALTEVVNAAVADVRAGKIADLDAFSARTFPQLAHALVKFNDLALLQEAGSAPARAKASSRKQGAPRASNGNLVIPPFSTVTYATRAMCLDMVLRPPSTGDGMRLLHISQKVPDPYRALFNDLCRLFEDDPKQRKQAQRMIWVIFHEPGQPKIDFAKWFTRDFLRWVRERHPQELEELFAKVERNNKTKVKGNSYANSPFAIRLRNRKKEQQAAARAERCTATQRLLTPRDCEDLPSGKGKARVQPAAPGATGNPADLSPEELEDMLEEWGEPQTSIDITIGVTLLPDDVSVGGQCTEKLTPELTCCNPTGVDKEIPIGEWCAEPMPGVQKQMVSPQGYRANAYQLPAYKMWNEQQLRAADYLFQKFLDLIRSILGEPLLAKLKQGALEVAANFAKSRLSPAMWSKLVKAGSLLPFVGNVIGAFEFYTGHNLLTMKPLSPAERIAAFVAMVPGGMLLKYAQKTMPTLMKTIPMPKAALASTVLEKSIGFVLDKDFADFTTETLGSDAALSQVLQYNQNQTGLLQHEGFLRDFQQHQWSKEWEQYMDAYGARFEEMARYSKVL